jgi:NADPH2:quinone reductase
MQAIRVNEHGGADVLGFEQVPDPSPGPGQVLVRLEAIGVNFIDVYQRIGLYKLPLPFTLGQEGAGIVESVGDGVTEARVGDRVAWAGPMGSYAEYAVIPAERTVPVPPAVGSKLAAAAMLQGMTAHYLATSTYKLDAGDWCVVHAAAGGVGLLLTQIAKLRGARVIGTVSTEAKAALARDAGADVIVRYTEQDFAAEARRVTGGAGVQVVYDSVGRTTFEKSLDALARRGMMVLFGQSSGPVPPFDPQMLNQKGSLFLTRPKLQDYVVSREELLRRGGEVMSWIQSGELSIRIGLEVPLAEAVRAHTELEARRTTGKVVLIP